MRSVASQERCSSGVRGSGSLMSPSTDDDGETRLYRAVSQEELDDIISFNGFRPGTGQLETKLLPRQQRTLYSLHVRCCIRWIKDP